MIIKLLISAFGNALLAILFYLFEKQNFFNKISYKYKQSIYGVCFGIMAIYASTSFGGIPMSDGAIINVRDSAPLCAGLIFGAPAGIIAGLIGGMYRYISVFFGLSGEYTQLACSISTILVGFIAAILRKFMFDNKKPTWLYGFGIGMVCEILHMLMIFITNMSDTSTAFTYVKICTIPMCLGNGIAIGLAIIGVSFFCKEKFKLHSNYKQISQTFQFWLFMCIVVAYIIAGIFISVLQTGVSNAETENVIKTNLEDIYQDIVDASNENLLNKVKAIKEEYISGADVSYLAKKYNVTEVNIINEKGIIANTNNKEYIGYDMSSGEQSKEFLKLLNGNKLQYVQEYRPTSYDNKTLRKYGAITLENGGFLQVGYDASQFRNDVDNYINYVIKNRHIGNNGFIVICDEDYNIIITTKNIKHSEKEINNFSIRKHKNKIVEEQIFEVLANDTEYLCAYRFVEGYYIVGVIPKNEAMFLKDVSIYVNVFMEIIIFAILFVLIYFLIKKIIIDNIKKINSTLSQITNGNLDVTVDVRSNEEFASLSDDINSTVSTLKKYIKEAAARIDKELEFAKQIQYSSLPMSFPARIEFDLYAKMTAAKEVGGDFYDFYMLNDNTVAFLIADVSGKGIPAAMFMMKAKTTIKDLAESGLEPDEIFTKANAKLCENNEVGMFVTAWLGILNLKTCILKFANAGHNPPLIYTENNSFKYFKVRSGIVLAAMEETKYSKNEIQFLPGSKIFLYTDGVTEATNINSQFYGDERLINFINSCKDTTSENLCKLIKKDVNTFVGTAPQFDDITMLAFKFNCLIDEDKIIIIPNKNSHSIVNNFIENLISKLEIETKISSKINTIFDEIYSNIVNYSSANSLTIQYKIKNDRLFITFIDDGIEFNPVKATDPDTTLSAEDREIGGLGIFMIKKMAEEMKYMYKNNKNILEVLILLK